MKKNFREHQLEQITGMPIRKRGPSTPADATDTRGTVAARRGRDGIHPSLLKLGLEPVGGRPVYDESTWAVEADGDSYQPSQASKEKVGKTSEASIIGRLLRSLRNK